METSTTIMNGIQGTGTTILALAETLDHSPKMGTIVAAVGSILSSLEQLFFTGTPPPCNNIVNPRDDDDDDNDSLAEEEEENPNVKLRHMLCKWRTTVANRTKHPK
jgi:hypothetical protein